MSDANSNIESSAANKNASSTLVFVIILVVVISLFGYLFFQDDEPEIKPVVIEEVIAEPEVIVPVKTEIITEPVQIEKPVELKPEVLKPVLPALDASDDFIIAKVTDISWRKELLGLLITDDLVRRVVVFTDNFSRGEIAYSHLPLKPLTGKFSVKASTNANEAAYLFNESNFTRYEDYIELLNSFEPEALASNFIQNKPLFEQAFTELGYPDQSFEQVLQLAIDRILDFPVLSEQPLLVQPSVVYKYQKQELEELAAADKFLLRLGKENLLQLKAIALALDNQLNLQNNQ